MSSHSDSDGMGSIPASPDALHVPLLLCQERFNEASLPVFTVSCARAISGGEAEGQARQAQVEDEDAAERRHPGG